MRFATERKVLKKGNQRKGRAFKLALVIGFRLIINNNLPATSSD